MARTRQPGAQRQQAYHATVQMEGPAPPTGDELELDLDHLLASLNAHTDDCDDLLADHMLTGEGLLPDFDMAGVGWAATEHQMGAPLLSTEHEREVLSWDELMYPSGLEDLPHMPCINQGIDGVRRVDGTCWAELGIEEVANAAAGLLAVLGEPSGAPSVAAHSTPLAVSDPFQHAHMEPQQAADAALWDMISKNDDAGRAEENAAHLSEATHLQEMGISHSPKFASIHSSLFSTPRLGCPSNPSSLSGRHSLLATTPTSRLGHSGRSPYQQDSTHSTQDGHLEDRGFYVRQQFDTVLAHLQKGNWPREDSSPVAAEGTPALQEMLQQMTAGHVARRTVPRRNATEMGAPRHSDLQQQQQQQQGVQRGKTLPAPITEALPAEEATILDENVNAGGIVRTESQTFTIDPRTGRQMNFGPALTRRAASVELPALTRLFQNIKAVPYGHNKPLQPRRSEGNSAVPKAVRVPLVRRNSRSGGSTAPVSPESRRLLRTRGFVHPGKLAEIEAEFRTGQETIPITGSRRAAEAAKLAENLIAAKRRGWSTDSMGGTKPVVSKAHCKPNRAMPAVAVVESEIDWQQGGPVQGKRTNPGSSRGAGTARAASALPHSQQGPTLRSGASSQAKFGRITSSVISAAHTASKPVRLLAPSSGPHP